MQSIWFLVLVSTICLEGLGRKYLPQIPSVAFYFLKDPVLLFGMYYFRPPPDVRQISSYLYRGFGIVWVVGFVWTVMELFNPEQQSYLLGIIGLRAYWLWWIAPPIIATVLQDAKQKRRALYVLLFMAMAIAALAILQFAAPPDSSVNLYSVVDGEEVYADVAAVSATGRARVSSTFSFLSGFQDFTTLIPTLLLSIGLDAREPRLRRLAFGVTLLTAAVVPMSGSRASVLLGAAVLAITAWVAGLFFTSVGRRILIGSIFAAVLALAAFPDAFVGIQSRFADTDETNTRYEALSTILPPIALAMNDYPAAGIGTGMQQNAHFSMHIVPQWEMEMEPARYLVELGPIGYLMVWTAKLGLIVALLRAYGILKRAGRRGAAAAAVSYAVLTMNGNLTFDHIWQALYFIGCGFILAEVVSVRREAAASSRLISEEAIAIAA
jgi:hypothetical protein